MHARQAWADGAWKTRVVKVCFEPKCARCPWGSEACTCSPAEIRLCSSTVHDLARSKARAVTQGEKMLTPLAGVLIL